MEHHPIADVWPMLQPEQLADLANDIKENGQLLPIWTYEGKILDGRNRHGACLLAGVVPALKEYTGDEPVAFAWRMNEKRRHMTTGQRAALAAEMMPMLKDEARKRQAHGETAPGRTLLEKVPEALPAPATPAPTPLPTLSLVPPAPPPAPAAPPPVPHTGGQPFKPQGIPAPSTPAPAPPTPQPIAPPPPAPTSRDQAAAITGTNSRYVTQAEKVKDQAPEAFKKLKAGKMSMQDAMREVRKKPVDPWREDERGRQSRLQDGTTVVANAEKDKNLIAWATAEGLVVSVGRGSLFGNPFVMGKDGTRDEVCDAYENYYIPHKPSIAKRVGDLRGKLLVCHCYPQRCHADTLKALAEAAQ